MTHDFITANKKFNKESQGGTELSERKHDLDQRAKSAASLRCGKISQI